MRSDLSTPPKNLSRLSLSLLLCIMFTLGARTWTSASAEEAEVPRAVDVLPNDCVFVICGDMAALSEGIHKTSFAYLLASPECGVFLKQPIRELVQTYQLWRKRFPALPSAEALRTLGTARFAFGLRPVAGQDRQSPTQALACMAIHLVDPGATLTAMKHDLAELPVVHMPSGAEVRGSEGLYLGMQSSWLLFGSSAQEVEQFSQAIKDKKDGLGKSERWRELSKRIGDDCELTIWADLKPIQDFFFHVPEAPNVRDASTSSLVKLMATLGLDSVRALALGLKTRGPRYDFRIGVEAPAQKGSPRRGIVKLLEGEGPLEAEHLQMIPSEAEWFYLTRMNVRELPELLKESFVDTDGDPIRALQLDVVLWGFSALAGFDLQKDLLDNFGDVWIVNDTGGGGALMELMPGLAVTATAKDPNKLYTALSSLFDLLVKQAPEHLGAKVKSLSFGDQEIKYISLALTDCSPCFAILGKQVVFSWTVSSIKRQLSYLLHREGRKDIRHSILFQSVYREAFGVGLTLPPHNQADEEPLPTALRFLTPGAAHPSRTLGMLLGAAHLFGPRLPGFLETKDGLRRSRLLAALRLLGMGMGKYLASEESEPHLPEQPRQLLNLAGMGVAQITDLSSIYFRRGIRKDDPGQTIVAYTVLSRGWEGRYSVLRLNGQIEEMSSVRANEELNAQLRTLRERLLSVIEIRGDSAPGGKPSAWLTDAWNVQSEERRLLFLDGMRILESIDFALLPDLKTVESLLLPGISWTQSDDWGIVSRTLTSYPLPAADLTGAAVPAALATLVLPEIVKITRINNEAAIASDLQAIVHAQSAYRLLDWDGDGTFEFAPTLDELNKRGLISMGIALGEVRDGATPLPKSGYFFKMLNAQGPAATGGAKPFAARGKWIHGYAVLAWPAQYGKTGRMTLMLGPDGKVYQSDFFEVTGAHAEATATFDPSRERGWQVRP